MKLKVRNQISIRRVYTVALLIFIENFLAPLIGITGSNQWPTLVQLAHILFTATLQVVTVLYALMEVAKPQTKE